MCPPDSIYNVCHGDMVVIICNTTDIILDWIWQNHTTGRRTFTMYAVESSQQMLNVKYNFTDVPGVTATLLERTAITSSSLQFTISDEFEKAHIECNGDHRDIVAASKWIQVLHILIVMYIYSTECSATPTNFTITHYNGGTNMSSICLLWDTQTNLAFTYYIYVSDDSKTILNKTTNVSSVSLNLIYGRNYSIYIYASGCGITHIVSTIALILSNCNIPCTTVHGVVTFPENKTIEISYNLLNSYECPCKTPTTTNSDIQSKLLD